MTKTPVAWMHDDPKRVDVIHADVKNFLANAGAFHRPLDKSERYTIPLYSQEVVNELHAENARLREALRRLYGCFATDPFPLPKEVQRIVGEALKESEL